MTSRHIRLLAVTGLTAAVYTVINLFLPFLAYGEIQCRFSEILNLLAFINPNFAPGIILGCFLTNLFSPIPFDWLIGTVATALTMFCITRSKSLFVASLWPTLFCVFIGAEITLLVIGPPYFFSTFALTTLSVMAGEFIAMTLIGYPVFKYIMRNERLMKLLKSL